MNETCLRRPTKHAPDPRKSTGARVAGVGAFSGSLRGLKLVPTNGVVLSRTPAALYGINNG